MTKFVEFLFFILYSKFLSTSHFEIPCDYEQVFRQINDKILATIDNVFVSLKINTEFTKSKSVKERIRIHKFIQNASEIKFRICKDIKDISKAEQCDKKMRYFVTIISEITRKNIIREWGQLKTIRISRKRVKNATVNDDEHIPGTNFMVDFAHFEKKFNKGVDTLITDIVHNNWFVKKSNRKEDQYSKEWEPERSELKSGRRIYDGRETSIRKFPFMASVLIKTRFICAGAIITKFTVITAASCLRQYHAEKSVRGESVTVRVGSKYTSRSGEVIPVEELNFHPLFDRESMDNNLVIVILSKRLKFGKHIRKITIDTKAEKLPEDIENIIILGWGKKSHTDKIRTSNKVLAYAYSNVYSLEECKNIYSRFYIKDKQFCAGFVSKGSGACNNDIGGPAVIGSTLTGIISFGSPHCGRPDAPTVFTKIGFYSEWINSIVERIKKEKYILRKQFVATTPEPDLPLDPNIDEEIYSLAQLIGEMQVVKHINTSMNEILKERQNEVKYGKINPSKSYYDLSQRVSSENQSLMLPKHTRLYGLDEKQNYVNGELNGKSSYKGLRGAENERAHNTSSKSHEEYEVSNSSGGQSDQTEEFTETDTNIPQADMKNDDDLLEVVFVKDGTTRMFKRTQKSKVKFIY